MTPKLRNVLQPFGGLMGEDPLDLLRICLTRAEGMGRYFDSDAVETGLISLDTGAVPEDPALLNTVESFLDFVDRETGFAPVDRAAARDFLDRLQQGRGNGGGNGSGGNGRGSPPVGELIRVGPRFSLPVPRGKEVAVDLLVYEPAEALQDLYQRAREHGLGNSKQYEAIEKALRLERLTPAESRQLRQFFEIFQRGEEGFSRVVLERARFLTDLLSSNRPKDLAGSLKNIDVVPRLRELTRSQEILLTGDASPTAAATKTLDDLLVGVADLVYESSRDGDGARLEKLGAAARKVVDAIRELKGRQVILLDGSTPISGKSAWMALDQMATNPWANAALMPLGLAEHILAATVMGELSWEESIDEAWETMGGALIVGGTIFGSVAAWNGVAKFLGDKKLGEILGKVGKLAPPAVRSFLIPLLVLSAFAFIALRESQDLPLEEEGEYRWQFLEEIAAGFGIQLAVTGGVVAGLKYFLEKAGRAPTSKVGRFGILGAATGAGMLAQEIYSNYGREKFRGELKEKTYSELLDLLAAMPTVSPLLRKKMRHRIDRKMAILIALNVLEFKSLEAAKRRATKREEVFQQFLEMGLSESQAIRLLGSEGDPEPLTLSQQELVERWIERMTGKKHLAHLPVTMLPAQKKRILKMWESELADVVQYLEKPVSLIPTDSLREWGMPQTMALLRQYIQTAQMLEWEENRPAVVSQELRCPKPPCI